MTKELVFVDTKQLDRLRLELKGFEAEIGTATYHAINRTVDHVATQIGRIVTQHYAIKAKDVKATLRKRKPSIHDLSASIESKGHTLSLAHFPHSPKQPPTKKRKYKVRATIKKGQRKTVTTDPKPFIASTGAQNPDKVQYNVFRRVGTARLPIVVIRTLSVPQMITNEGVAEKIQEAALTTMSERLEHEIIRAMLNIGKNVKR